MVEALTEFQDAILKDPGVEALYSLQGKGRFLAINAMKLAHHVSNRLLPERVVLPQLPRRFRSKDYFGILMGNRFGKVAPYFVRARHKALYMFDAWPRYHSQIRTFANRFGVDVIIFSSSQVAEKFENFGDTYVTTWVPEGVDPSRYKHLPPDRRDIDVLHFGRQYLSYHQKIVGPLQRMGRVYVYQREGGDRLFATNQAFVDGLSRAKISVCAPASVTHPMDAGSVTTMTLRYLQSMASKSLPVGILPSEMRDLFGYDPVIEISSEDPAGQLDDILSHYDTYLPLIERNYNTVCQKHTWQCRWKEIGSILRKQGFELPS